MSEATVTNRREVVESARALFRQINDVAALGAILQAAQREVDKPGTETFGPIVGADAVMEYAVKALQERLNGIHERMEDIFKAAGVDGLVFGDEAMGLTPE